MEIVVILNELAGDQGVVPDEARERGFGNMADLKGTPATLFYPAVHDCDLIVLAKYHFWQGPHTVSPDTKSVFVPRPIDIPGDYDDMLSGTDDVADTIRLRTC